MGESGRYRRHRWLAESRLANGNDLEGREHGPAIGREDGGRGGESVQQSGRRPLWSYLSAPSCTGRISWACATHFILANSSLFRPLSTTPPPPRPSSPSVPPSCSTIRRATTTPSGEHRLLAALQRGNEHRLHSFNPVRHQALDSLPRSPSRSS